MSEQVFHKVDIFCLRIDLSCIEPPQFMRRKAAFYVQFRFQFSEFCADVILGENYESVFRLPALQKGSQVLSELLRKPDDPSLGSLAQDDLASLSEVSHVDLETFSDSDSGTGQGSDGYVPVGLVCGQ